MFLQVEIITRRTGNRASQLLILLKTREFILKDQSQMKVILALPTLFASKRKTLIQVNKLFINLIDSQKE
jgi:hypothetical protein